MAVKSLEEGAPLPIPHKDTERTLAGCPLAYIQKGLKRGKGMFSFHSGQEAAGVVQVTGEQGLN